MFYAKGTFAYTWAFRQFFFLFPRDVVACTLSLVALFAEVCVAPAEPLRDRTAELAFKLDKFCPMCLALIRADP